MNWNIGGAFTMVDPNISASISALTRKCMIFSEGAFFTAAVFLETIDLKKNNNFHFRWFFVFERASSFLVVKVPRAHRSYVHL